MRIGFVTDTYTPQVNGVTTVVRRIAALLRAQGHEAAVVAPRYPGSGVPPEPSELRVPSVAFPLYPEVRLSLPSFRRVAAFFDQFQPGVQDVARVPREGPRQGYVYRGGDWRSFALLAPAPVTHPLPAPRAPVTRKRLRFSPMDRSLPSLNPFPKEGNTP